MTFHLVLSILAFPACIAGIVGSIRAQRPEKLPVLRPFAERGPQVVPYRPLYDQEKNP